MYVLTRNDLPGFVDALREYFPESLQIYAQSRNILLNRCFWPGTEVVVDRYPDFAVCVTRPVPGSEDYIPRPKVWQQCVTLFSKTDAALEKILNEEGIIDWYRPICFLSIPSKYVPVIVKRAEVFGFSKGTEDHLRHDVFVIKSGDYDGRSVPSLPEGCRIGLLEVHNVDQILAEWNPSSLIHGDHNEDKIPCLQYMLTHDFPSSAILTDTNELIAYCLYSANGSISHGFVRKEWRNRGLFQIVCRDLVEKITKDLRQEVTWAHIEESNEASKKLFTKLGAKRAANWQTSVLDYMPYV